MNVEWDKENGRFFFWHKDARDTALCSQMSFVEKKNDKVFDDSDVVRQ